MTTSLYLTRDGVEIFKRTFKMCEQKFTQLSLNITRFSVLAFDFIVESNERCTCGSRTCKKFSQRTIRRVWTLEQHHHPQAHFVSESNFYTCKGIVEGLMLEVHIKKDVITTLSFLHSGLAVTNEIGSLCTHPHPIPLEFQGLTPYRYFCHGVFCSLTEDRDLPKFIHLYSAYRDIHLLYLVCIILKFVTNENLAGLNFLYSKNIRSEFQDPSIEKYVQFISSTPIKLWFAARFEKIRTSQRALTPTFSIESPLRSSTPSIESLSQSQ